MIEEGPKRMKTAHKSGAGTAAIIAVCVPFAAGWEGTDLTAKVDTNGTEGRKATLP
jgi:hypothetical protein